MEAGLIIGNQIIIMFIILIIGAFCYLKGIITKDGTKQLSSFALNIINPVLIFISQNMTRALCMDCCGLFCCQRYPMQ